MWGQAQPYHVGAVIPHADRRGVVVVLHGDRHAATVKFEAVDARRSLGCLEHLQGYLNLHF